MAWLNLLPTSLILASRDDPFPDAAFYGPVPSPNSQVCLDPFTQTRVKTGVSKPSVGLNRSNPSLQINQYKTDCGSSSRKTKLLQLFPPSFPFFELVIVCPGLRNSRFGDVPLIIYSPHRQTAASAG